MRAVMLMYDSLNRNMLTPYGCDWTHTPNFERLAKHCVRFDNSYVGSMPCMPARRELHTGRYNFLHRSWGPLEPFDDSMPEMLRDHGIHSHLITDHYHYFEDGGATYHTRYRNYQNFRGQEGDAWKDIVKGVGKDNLNGRQSDSEYWNEQDMVNRSFEQSAEKQPQGQTFGAAIEYLDLNHDADNWFLQIETFDPHEPFFTQEKYKALYRHEYHGKLFDWPEYRKVTEDAEAVNHIRMEYAALLSMCDENLGRVLDKFDEYSLWDDTMLIVNTDHGFMLGEHGHWAKCYFPFYNEIANTPLFIWDPRVGKAGTCAQSLVQSIDLPATVLDYFSLPLPRDMQGKPLRGVLQSDERIREGALFGICGGQINVTDGRYLLMKSPKAENKPLYQYTLMPTRHGGRRGFINADELKTARMHAPLPFTKDLPVMQLDYTLPSSQHLYPTMLFDLQSDPHQLHPIADAALEARMTALMARLMKENDCPSEQFIRMGMEEYM